MKMFASVCWENKNDTMDRPYYPVESYQTAKNYVFTRLAMTSIIANETIGVSAKLENVKYHGMNSYLRHHYQSKKVLKWVSPSGYSTVLFDGVQECDVDPVFQYIPSAAICKDYLNVNDLVQALGVCDELDDIHVMKRGMSREKVRLNTTEYPQPRRITWSVEIGDCYMLKSTGPTVRDLFCYGQSFRNKLDWKARSMPNEIFTLGLHLWYAAYSNLSSISRVCPPTSCQLLIYHSYFDGKMGFHRDVQLPGLDISSPNAYSPDKSSQIRGSSVLIYNIGDPMLFEFKIDTAEVKTEKKQKKDKKGKEALSVSLGDGDLLVLDPRDDETYKHGVKFVNKSNPNKELQVRIALVYRWISDVQPFYVDGLMKYGLFCEKDEDDSDKNREHDSDKQEEDSQNGTKQKDKTSSKRQLKRSRPESWENKKSNSKATIPQGDQDKNKRIGHTKKLEKPQDKKKKETI
jgi:hypothetical protein